jgi:hypothetical protein
MLDIASRWNGVTDRERWAARGASFVAKLKATKVVWFPPEPVETGKKTAATAKKTTKRATKKTAAAAKKSTSGTTKKVNKSVRPKATT